MPSAQLPLWIEYVKALGAPIVALLAAAIAGGIAYRQWVTARNKLKLDLFDRRIAIYNDAVSLIGRMARREFDGAHRELINKVAHGAATAQWLLNTHVAHHLRDLINRAESLKPYDDPLLAAWSRGEKINYVPGMFDKVREQTDLELKNLDRIFTPFMYIHH